MRANVIRNILILAGHPNHPDILETFGDNGYWMVDCVFERNYVIDCPVQLTDFSFKSTIQPRDRVHTDSRLWGMVLRNNVFVDSDMQCSIDIPNVR